MTTRLSTKGQLIIPKKIRDRHGWRSGTELKIEDLGDCLIVRLSDAAPETTLDELVGCTGYQGPSRTLGDMEAAIAAGARESR
ncbi:MAG: AbrB/MazE/SpoVT family DNA-binding domain-containing protein [bacterium]|nr:AbrB/MazE/SpoVT family DNA-binding domain-containing protein [bacterium]